MLTEKEMQRKIRAVPEGVRKGILIDEGFILDVLKSRKMVWRYRFTDRRGKELKVKLGEYPGMSLRDARIARDKLRGDIASGEYEEKKKAVTFGEVFETLIKRRVEGVCTEKYLQNMRIYMKRFISMLGDMPINEITSSDVLRVIEAAESDGVYSTAHKIKQTAGQVFRFAAAAGLVTADPTYMLTGLLQVRKVKHMPRITDPELAGRLMRDIRDKGHSPTMRIFLQLHAYTFVRPKEIREAEWGEFDLAAGVWKIPAEKMKMRRVHIVPLARQSIELVSELYKLTGHGRYLFHAWGCWDGSRHISDNAENKALRRRGYAHDVMVGHGFRGMASTFLYEAGFNSQVIEIQLAHADSNSVRASYNEAEFMQRRRVMCQWYADYLDSLRDDTAPPPFPQRG